MTTTGSSSSAASAGVGTESGPALAAQGTSGKAVRSKPAKAPRSLRYRLTEWALIVALAVGVALAVRAYVVQSYYIPSGSMEPTLLINNRILVNRLAYDLGSVHTGDIVVFATPPDDKADPGVKDLVKRVVGLPGQVISSEPDGRVLINGKPLAESYLLAGHRAGPGAGPGVCAIASKPFTCSAGGGFRIPKGEYFVMGDNRNDSYDSRYFGPISGSLIVGKVVMKVWPLNQITIYR